MDKKSNLCPFCGLKTDSEYQIVLHVETKHPEGGESPFIVKDDASVAAVVSLNGDGDDDVEFASCPHDGCGEEILLTELESHIEMHRAEEQDIDQDSVSTSGNPEMEEAVNASFNTELSRGLRNLNGRGSSKEMPLSDQQAGVKAGWDSFLKMLGISVKLRYASPTKDTRRRLGKSELGPHAHESQMPNWLVQVLKSDGQIRSVTRLSPEGKPRKFKVSINHAAGVLPVLRQLLNQDPYTQFAYLCHPVVKHISKLRREGGFCGYRNIQMLTSYINGVESQGYEFFNNKIPTIFEIQDYIENAWARGINSQGLRETGGIRGTRKYIGTLDAQAMFCSLGIECNIQAFKTKRDSPPADHLLFQAVENYFVNGCTDFDGKVRLTPLPPLYFQRPGHSMTIVGIEQKMDGSKTLLVFDPMYHDASNVMRLVGQTFTHRAPDAVLMAYRRDTKYLSKYNEFEFLKLTPPHIQSGNVEMGSW